jgi:integrase
MRKGFPMKEQPIRQFYLHSRNGIIYVQFVDPETKKCLTPKSTGKTNRDEAMLIVYEWLKNGVPKKHLEQPRPVKEEISLDQAMTALKNTPLTKEDVSKIEKILQNQGLITMIVQKNSSVSQDFMAFLRNFWTYESSPYVEERLSHKIHIGRKHVKLYHERAEIYWAPYFKGMSLGEITRKHLIDFSSHISKTYSALSPCTLRLILYTGTKALRWAYANEYIPINPATNLPEYSSKQKERGVLSPKEAIEIFRMEWTDRRSYIINLVAMTTGLRSGEILALKSEDIGDKYLYIKHSYSPDDGLKGTKTGKPRVVPIIPGIRDALRELGAQNPYGNGFVFYGTDPLKPLSASVPLRSLYSALIQMKAGDKLKEYCFERSDSEEEKARKRAEREAVKDEASKYWKERNIVFHSWRHFYASRMTDRIEARKVMLATGHTTKAVFKTYSDHALESDLMEVAETTSEVFGALLPEAILKEEGREKAAETI